MIKNAFISTMVGGILAGLVILIFGDMTGAFLFFLLGVGISIAWLIALN